MGQFGRPAQPARVGLGNARDARFHRRSFPACMGIALLSNLQPPLPSQSRNPALSWMTPFAGKAVSACAESARPGGISGSRGKRVSRLWPKIGDRPTDHEIFAV